MYTVDGNASRNPLTYRKDLAGVGLACCFGIHCIRVSTRFPEENAAGCLKKGDIMFEQGLDQPSLMT